VKRSRGKPISFSKVNVAACEAIQESFALVTILALGRLQVEEGRSIPLVQAAAKLRARRVRR
jgi:hypothetical protein